jgi:hypothetical protein
LPEENTWVVLDHFQDSSPRATTTTWTFYPDLVVASLPDKGRYRIAARNSSTSLLASFSGSREASTSLLSGSRMPFAGWVVLDRIPTAAPAIIVRQPSRESWSLATFTLSNGSSDAAGLARGGSMTRWTGVDNWEVTVATETGTLELARDGDRLSLNRGGSSPPVQVAIEPINEPALELAAVRDAFHLASKKYKKFVELIHYRVRLTYLLLAVLVIQELLLFAMRRRLPRAAASLRVASWVSWAVGGIWLSLVYFNVA